MESIGTPWMWTCFVAIVLVMLAIDLFALGGGRQRRVGVREAAGWSAIWVGVSLAFAGGLWWYLDGTAGREVANGKALEFITGYLIEKSLAVDNVFVWLMLFSFFAVPIELQKRVLVYGVLGAIVLRALMIFAGVWLIARFDWILYVFGAFLLITGVKMWWFAEQEPDLAKNPLLRWLRGHLRLTDRLEGERFLVIREVAGRPLRYATPLLLALILVEISDVIFAVDSIPAIFAITTDPFIVLTSNVFAILGLRAMYFLLADMADRFTLLKYGLALVLVFIGGKMLLLDVFKIPVAVSLAVVASIIGTSVVLSLRRTSPPGAGPVTGNQQEDHTARAAGSSEK
ncbi:TerC family protein [Accumulibacter sp.]|uniref:TerC family protein n=1 Tax=Accumulibacter sp. TaxID=2053492 RepID=UPI0025F3116B|nr:TerC family protein [Accumulibacter sp.]MCM8594602.1 TerC family protein [Accumulibacter sp.]MCM8627239.1 TerC family protein [Accumulibacter sp.]MDS4048748.1 TerC family protein [Accumulibacter sp.]